MNPFEKKIIGGVVKGLLRPSDVGLAAGDFESDEAGAIIAHAQTLEADGVQIDADILHMRVSSGEQSFYTPDDFRLMAAAVNSSSVVYEAVEKVKSSALKTMILSETAKLALLEDKGSPELLDRLNDLVTRATNYYKTSENNFVFLAEIAPKMRAVYTELFNNVSYAVPTYFPLIDDQIIDGFSRGDEHIIVGFTGAGKSALALEFAKRQALRGHVVGVVSREMSDIENTMRLQSSHSEIPRFLIKKGMRESTYKKLNDGLDEIAHLPIAFDTRTTDVKALSSQVRRMVESHNLEILYVDYLQLLSSSGDKSTRANEVQSISRTLKEIAMENKIPVVSLCQFNRGAANASIFDILGYLKESSGIEQDASSIMYVQVEKCEQPKEIKDAKITILKNRNGATFQSIDLLFKGMTFTFFQDDEQNAFNS